MASFLLGALLTILHPVPALAGMELAQLSVKKGVLLRGQPIPERSELPPSCRAHPGARARGNRRAYSESLHECPPVPGIAGPHRAQRDQPPDLCWWPGRAIPISPAVPTQGASSRRTIGLRRGLCGGHTSGPGTHHYAGQADRNLPGLCRILPDGLEQLEAEMLLGAWGICRQIRSAIFDQDPATLWLDCLSRLQAPRVEGVAWVVPIAHGTPTIKRWLLDARR